MDKNNSQELLEMLYKSQELQKDYAQHYEELVEKEKSLYTPEVEAYFNCLQELEDLAKTKETEMNTITSSCKHNLSFLSSCWRGALNGEIARVYLTYECVCCGQEFLSRYNKFCTIPYCDFRYERALYEQKQLICGYNPNQIVPFIPATEYLGENAGEIIALKCLEFLEAGVSDAMLEQCVFEYFEREFQAMNEDKKSYNESDIEKRDKPCEKLLKYYSPKYGRKRADTIIVI